MSLAPHPTVTDRRARPVEVGVSPAELNGIKAALSVHMVLLALTLGLLACPALEPSRLELVGVLDDDDPGERVAVLRDSRASRSFTVRPGDFVEGSSELRVEAGALVVRRLRARVERIECGRVLLETRHGLEVASSTTAWVEQRECRPLFDFDAARYLPAFEGGVPIGFKLFSIRPDSAWSTAGFENGDVVERVNGQELTDVLVLSSWLRCARQLNIELRRGNERISLTLLPAETIASEARFLLRGQRAFVVAALAPRSLLARAGLRNGDGILGIDNEPLTIRFMRDGEQRRAIVRSNSELSAIKALNPSDTRRR